MNNKNRLTKILIIVLFCMIYISSCWRVVDQPSNTQSVGAIQNKLNEVADKWYEIQMWVKGGFSINE